MIILKNLTNKELIDLAFEASLIEPNYEELAEELATRLEALQIKVLALQEGFDSLIY
jgi:hypothetical protein